MIRLSVPEVRTQLLKLVWVAVPAADHLDTSRSIVMRVRQQFAAGGLAGPCPDRRIPDVDTLRRAVAAWESTRNAAEVAIDWQFTTADARDKTREALSQDSGAMYH